MRDNNNDEIKNKHLCSNIQNKNDNKCGIMERWYFTISQYIYYIYNKTVSSGMMNDTGVTEKTLLYFCKLTFFKVGFDLDFRHAT